MQSVLEVAGAIIVSLGGGALLVVALSSWLGKVWADRILETDRARYRSEIEILKSDLSKKIHEHNVAVSRVDSQRAEAVQNLYASLIEWFVAALQIRAPTDFQNVDIEVALATYTNWARVLRERSETLERMAPSYAILLTEETYEKVAKCGISVSRLTVGFCDAVFSREEDDPDRVLETIEAARVKLENEYKKDFEPAKQALIAEFRAIIDPRIESIDEI